MTISFWRKTIRACHLYKHRIVSPELNCQAASLAERAMGQKMLRKIDCVMIRAAHGCQVLVAPFDITIGKCAVVSDPFGTRLCILDLTKGLRPLNLVGSTMTDGAEEEA